MGWGCVGVTEVAAEACRLVSNWPQRERTGSFQYVEIFISEYTDVQALGLGETVLSSFPVPGSPATCCSVSLGL